MQHKVHLELLIEIDDVDPIYCKDECQFLDSGWHFCKLHRESLKLIERDEDYALYSHQRCSQCIAPPATILAEAFHEAAGAFQQISAVVELELPREETLQNLEQARARFSRAQEKARRL